MNKNYSLVFSSSDIELLKTIKINLEASSMSYSWITLPKKRKRFTLLRSPHVNNKSKEHFEIVVYRRLLKFCVTYWELKNFIKNLPTTVRVKITVAGNSAAW